MPRTRTVWFYVDDYEERLTALLTAAQAAEKRADDAPRRLGESSEYRQLIEQFNELKDEAQANARKVVLKAVSRKQWLDLKAAHPPRVEGPEQTVKGDAAYGVNTDTVEEDLVYAALVEPEFRSRAAFDEWAGEELSAAEFGRLAVTAFSLVAQAPDPKSLVALPIPSSDETSD